MALPSFSATCSYTGTSTYNQSAPPLSGRIVWQEAPTTGTLSTNSVPGASDQFGPCVLTVYAAANSWLSYGQAAPGGLGVANSSGTRRVPVPAVTLCYFTVEAGDKFMWEAA